LVRVVERVERLDTEQEGLGAAEPEVLVQAEIDVPVARSCPDADPGVAERAERGRLERRRVQVVVPATVAGLGIDALDDVRPLEREASVLERVARAPAGGGGARESTADRDDGAH